MNNKKGEVVLARWPRSQRYFEGSIQATEEGRCKILFKDGSEFWVKNQDIQGKKSAQTTAQKTERSRSRSKGGTTKKMERSRSKGGTTKKKERSRSRSKSVGKNKVERSRSRSKSVGKNKVERSRSRSKPGRPKKIERARSRSKPGRPKKIERSKSKPKKTEHSRSESDEDPSPQDSAKNIVAQKSATIKKQVVKPTPRASLRIIEKKASAFTSPGSEINFDVPINSEYKPGSSAITSPGNEINFDVPINSEYKPGSSDEEFDSTVPLIINREKSQSMEKEKLNEVNSSNIDESHCNIFKGEGKLKHVDQFPMEYGGVLTAVLCTILLPVFVLSLYAYASLMKDTGTNFLTIFKSWWNLSKIFKAFVLNAGFLILQVILMALPIGKTAQSLFGVTGMSVYRCNGHIAAFFTVFLLHILGHYYRTQFVYDIYVQLVMTALIFGIIAAILLYKRASVLPLFALNPHGNTGIFLYDFWIGREINPGIGRIDFKRLLIRYSTIGSVALNLILIEKACHEYTPTNSLFLCVILQFFYCTDYMWFEDTFPTTFMAMYEGVGYLLTMGNFLYPFIFTFISKFILDNRIVLAPGYLIAIGSVYSFGYMLYRGSNSQKSEFRRNFKSHAIAHLETIATNGGNRLLTSGYWGFVRHPNYLGDIIVQWSLASLCGLNHWLPYIIPLLTTLYLLTRACRDNRRCKRRYDTAWDLYCNKVKYKVIPLIF